MNTTRQNPYPFHDPQAAPVDAQKKCGNCASWTHHADARMAEQGQCNWRSTGHYTHKQQACLFNIDVWSPKKHV